MILYAGLRIPIDLLREYPTTRWGLPNGQTLNVVMLIGGLIALGMSVYRNRRQVIEVPLVSESANVERTVWQVTLLAAICLTVLVIPSDATRDVPATYRSRHGGLEYSRFYPNIADALTEAEDEKEGRKLCVKSFSFWTLRPGPGPQPQ
jgi:hypothetical protein